MCNSGVRNSYCAAQIPAAQCISHIIQPVLLTWRPIHRRHNLPTSRRPWAMVLLAAPPSAARNHQLPRPRSVRGHLPRRPRKPRPPTHPRDYPPRRRRPIPRRTGRRADLHRLPLRWDLRRRSWVRQRTYLRRGRPRRDRNLLVVMRCHSYYRHKYAHSETRFRS